MNIVFCVPGFSVSRLRLQPWLSFYRVAELLSLRGHAVTVLTDMVAEPVTGISLKKVGGFRGGNGDQLAKLIATLKPDKLVLPITPLSVVSQGWLGTISDCDVFAYISYPFYTLSEIARAYPWLKGKDKWIYARHLMVPSMLWAKRIRSGFSGVFCQSDSTAERLRMKVGGRTPVHCMLPGIDRDIWFCDRFHQVGRPYMLFVGSPYAIRGFDVLLSALQKMRGEPAFRLKILARGADSGVISGIKETARSMSIDHCVDISGGWMDVGEFRRQISNAVAVVLPFVLVPSEIPVSVMEAIACGTPVITTNIDGLPSTIADAGILVAHADPDALSDVIRNLWNDSDLQGDLRSRCQIRAREFPSWDDVSLQWEDSLLGRRVCNG